MNELVEKYSSKGLSIVGFPCNQFGHQENCSNKEILLSLKHVRPGDGFIPKIDMMAKIEVNGEKEHSIFKFLKSCLPYPSDNQTALMSNIVYIIWSPVLRSDISWNFEKFLIDSEGKPVKRFSKSCEPNKLIDDIEALLKQVN